jgi:cytoskeletal protein CcmA (bactofilin family)
VSVNTLILSGELTGNIEAKTRVEIHAPGKVYGNITTPVLVIDEGVLFEGGCVMKTPEKSKVSILERKEEEEKVTKV